MTAEFKLPQEAYLDGNYRPLKEATPMLRGWDVYSVQSGLDLAGEDPGPVDGFCGERSLDAVESFQADHGLTQDRICGGLTMASICSVVARKLNRQFGLPKGIPYGHLEHESSLLPPNYTGPYPDGSRDQGVVQENSRFYQAAHAFDVRLSGAELCQRVVDYHAKYRQWGVTDDAAWRFACGAWNAPAWTDRLARGEPLADNDRQVILAYIESVTAYTDL